jgi:1-acyl-sn-glycerol-3-phosphate acyltransferase
MKLIARFLRRLLKFRYKVEIEGLDLLDQENTYLVMPSHIALVDPILMYAFLRQKLRLHPVATRRFYNNIFLKPFFKLMGAVPVDQFEKDQGSSEDAEKMMKQVSSALQHGQHILLYPQGELAKQGYQSIIGKKTAFYACQHAPKDTKFIMVNIR